MNAAQAALMNDSLLVICGELGMIIGMLAMRIFRGDR